MNSSGIMTYSRLINRNRLGERKIRPTSVSIIAALLFMTAAPAHAALVNVNFDGAFSTGEDLTGTLTYEAAANPTGEPIVEFFNNIRSFSVTSARFLATNGVDTLNGIDGYDSRIRYFSGDQISSNSIQFIQTYTKDHELFRAPPSFGLSIGLPTGTLSTAELPSAFSFSAGSGVSIDFSYSYLFPGGEFSGSDRAAITSITATPVVAAIPEPATWAMMVGGFGLIGGAMRVRRRQAVVTA